MLRSFPNHIESRIKMVSRQSIMDRHNPHHRYVTLYCSQSTQTGESQPGSDYEASAGSSDSEFPPIKIGKGIISPTDAMHQNPGLGKTNIINVVDTTAPVQHEKVSNHKYKTVLIFIIFIRPNPCCQRETLEPKILPMNAHQRNSVFLLMTRTT